MPVKENDPRPAPILKVVVETESNAPVRPAWIGVAFAIASRDGRPREPLDEDEPFALALEEDRPAEVTIDDEGVVTIDLGVMAGRRNWPRLPLHWKEGWPARVLVQAHGYLPARTSWIQVPMRVEDGPHRVELSSAPVVGGRVVDESGAPLGGVLLELLRRTDNRKWRGARSCFGVRYRDDNDVLTRSTTDAMGMFSLPYTEAAKVCIRARVPGRAPVVTEPIAVDLATPPAPCELVMTVLKSGVEGTVRDFDGAPTMGVPVVACRADGFAQYVTTDAAGRYRLPLPPGRYRVNRGDPTSATWSQPPGYSLFDPYRAHANVPAVDPTQFTVEVQAGGFTIWNLDARHPHDASLVVHVDAEWEDPASLPVRLLRVSDRGEADLAWPRRDEIGFMDGAPALFPDLPPGRYQVGVGMEEVEIELPAARCTELVVALTTATIDGRLLDAEGAGVVARLELDEPAPMIDKNPLIYSYKANKDTESEADGSFHFYLVRPGDCQLRVFLERGGKEILVYDAPLPVPTKGLHEPIIRLERPGPVE